MTTAADPPVTDGIDQSDPPPAVEVPLADPDDELTETQPAPDLDQTLDMEEEVPCLTPDR